MKLFLALIASLYCVFLIQPLQAQVSEAPPMAPVWVESSDSWQLPESNFIGAKMPMNVVHPRSFPAADGGDETASWARHKKAYPGIEYRIPISIQGGAYPFYYEILEAPAWLSIAGTVWENDYGVLKGVAPTQTGSQGTVRVKITDQQLTEKVVEFPLTVTDSTNDFLFVDDNAATSGDGSINSPFNSLTTDVLNDGIDLPGTYPGRIIYLRGGTHEFAPEGFRVGTSSVAQMHFFVDRYPYVFLGYPGEDARIDFKNARIILRDGSDMFWGGLTLQNSTLLSQSNFITVWAASRFTWFDTKLSNINSTPGQSNNGSIHSTGGETMRPYWTFWNLEITGAEGSGLGSFYSVQDMVFEDIQLISGPGSSTAGIMLKGVCDYVSIRRVEGGFGGGFGVVIRNYNRGSTGPKIPRHVEISYSLVGQPEGNPRDGNIITMLAVDEPSDVPDEPAEIWSYRNTVIGGHIGPEYDPYAHFSYEGNVSFVDRANHFPGGSSAASLTVEGNLTGSYAERSKYLDENYRLKAPHREDLLGKAGHEIHH